MGTYSIRSMLAVSVASVAVVAAAGPAFAQAKSFDVPSQAAARSIPELARQADIQILVNEAAVRGKYTPAVKGVMPTTVALDRLLVSTGLRVASNDGRTFTLAAFDADHAAAQAPAEPAAPDPAPQKTPPGDPPANEEIVITGSRVITNSNNSPTPLTTVSTERLAATTPSNVPDALNKLPSFALSSSQRTSGNPSTNGAGNFLNLRGFGPQRTLILLDGARVPPTAANGTVDINTLPQMLMQRVDVVTGGASAVYGSDAVTGVVNFVLDKKFEGLKATAQAGISGYGDNASYRLGVAGGASFLDDRLHVEGSFEHYYSHGIRNKLDRPYGKYAYTTTGSGTDANPFRLNINSRLPLSYTPGGYFSIARTDNPAPGALQGDYTFSANGVLVPFTHGLPSGSSGTESGGDGGHANMGYGYGADAWLTAKLRNDQAFARVDYEISDKVRVYAQGTFATATNFAVFFPQWFSATVLTSNPYLPDAVRDGLIANGTDRFTFSRSFQYRQGSGARGETRSFNGTLGFEGDILNNFRWNAYYTHGESRLNETDPGNINQQQLSAALDSTRDPVTNQIVCRVSLNPAGQAAYPGCQPFNPFGPNSETDGTFQFFDHASSFRLTNKLDDFAGSISGKLFDNWAGPVNVAVSGEYRDFSLRIDSDFLPTDLVDCTLLNQRTCPGLNAQGTGPATTTPAVWSLNVVSPVFAKQNVAEGAVEVNFPLLRDVPLVQALDLNGAFRYTRYSVSGNATTWKLGFTWEVNDELKFRGTRSRDFRAPTLQDLFNPIQAGISSYFDVLTNRSIPNMIVQSQGNPDLKPEVANTVTVGFVYRPKWLRGLSVAADWYQIKINNAIANVSGTDATVQNECINSGGTSAFCDFFVGRPGSATDSSFDNIPTRVLSRPFNVARTKTSGVDGEINYQTSAPGIGGGEGMINTRLLVSYQPKLTQQTLPGAVITDQAGAAGLAEWRLTYDLGYTSGPFHIQVQERWLSSEEWSTNPTLVFAEPKIPAIAYTDLNLSYKFGGGSGRDKPLEAFVAVENLFNKQPTLYIGTGLAGAPGFTYPAPRDQDVVGRYFTAGVRVRL